MAILVSFSTQYPDLKLPFSYLSMYLDSAKRSSNLFKKCLVYLICMNLSILFHRFYQIIEVKRLWQVFIYAHCLKIFHSIIFGIPRNSNDGRISLFFIA